MNKDNAKDYLPLVQAMADGKRIQFLNAPNEWVDSETMSLCYDPEFYRINPEPREWWICVNKGKNPYQSDSNPVICGCEQILGGNKREQIRVREILD